MIRFEIKKIFSKTANKIGLIVLLAAIAVTLLFCNIFHDYVDEEGIHTQELRQQGTCVIQKAGWERPDHRRCASRGHSAKSANQRNLFPDSPTDIKTSNIGYSKKQGFSDIRDLINSGFSEFREHNYYRADSLSEDEVGKLYDNRILNLEKWLNSDEAKDQFSEKEKAFLVSQYQKLETPFYYEYAGGFTAALDYAPTIIMLTVLIMSFFVAGIFSNEFGWKADSVFFSARYGRNRGTFSK